MASSPSCGRVPRAAAGGKGRGAECYSVVPRRHKPPDTCLDRVRFRLVRTAPYIFQDRDFEEPHK